MGEANSITGKPTRGRPKKFVDLELVEKLAHIQCTYAEIASTLGVSVDTLQRNKNFAAVYKRGAEGGRKSLRRMQFESANKGNIAMQIWLGKQYLGQSDHTLAELRRLPSVNELSLNEFADLVKEYLSQHPEINAHAETIDADDYTEEESPPARPASLLLQEPGGTQ